MSTPRVTVLMSMHNAARWLRSAIASVLDQTFTDFEFLIIDDASNDESVAITESFQDSRLRLLRSEENIGLTRCLNLGLASARGEFIARHDADDLSASTRLAEQVRFLDAHPEIALVGTHARLIDAAGRFRGMRELPCNRVAIRWLSLLDNPIVHTSAMFRTPIVRHEMGGYDEAFRSCQDYDLWTRLMERHAVANLPQSLVSVREHEGSVSATQRNEAESLVSKVVRRVAASLLPELGLSGADIELLWAYRRHLRSAEVADFHRVLARIDASFATRFPEAARDGDLASTRAGVLARIGYNLLTEDRVLAWSELRRAVRTSPKLATRLPWLRIVALSLFGGNALAWVDELRG